MSETFSLYVVDEKKLPVNLDGLTDQQKYDKLVEEVEAKGGKWAQLELSTVSFAEALETIDAQMDWGQLLPVFSFNNSPHDLLGKKGDCPCFGYFRPSVIQDLIEAMDETPKQEFDRFINDEGALGAVYSAYQSAIEEAGKRGYALAVIHS
jgi:hypothetical protein